jgi:plastocyanin
MTTATTPSRTRRWVPVLVLVAIGVIVLIIASLYRGDTGGSPDADGRLEIVMTDYRFAPSEIALPAGEQVTLVFINEDEVSHHVSFGRGVVIEDGAEVAYEEDLFATTPVTMTPPSARAGPSNQFPNVTILVEPGTTAAMQATVPEDANGDWYMGCFTARGCHFRTGLVGDVTVD